MSMQGPGFESLCWRMELSPKVLRRIYYHYEGRKYTNYEGKFFILGKNQSFPRGSLVLDENLERIADRSEKKTFRKVYQWERLAYNFLGSQRYREIGQLLQKHSYTLGDLLLGYKVGRNASELPEVGEAVRRVWVHYNPPQVPARIYFQYCSRSHEGVLPLRDLLDKDLIMHEDRYSVSTGNDNPDKLRQRIGETLGKKGLVRIITK